MKNYLLRLLNRLVVNHVQKADDDPANDRLSLSKKSKVRYLRGRRRKETAPVHHQPQIKYDPINGEEVYYSDDDDDDEDDAEQEELERMKKIWNSRLEPLKLPLPLDEPKYLHEEPDFDIAYTKSYDLRKTATAKKLQKLWSDDDGGGKSKKTTKKTRSELLAEERYRKSLQEENARKSRKRSGGTTTTVEHRTTKADRYRRMYLRREAIVPKSLVDYFGKHGKPPFSLYPKKVLSVPTWVNEAEIAAERKARGKRTDRNG